MSRALGVDFGTKRIGIAGSDDLGMTARGIEVVEERNLEFAADRVAAIAKERAAEVLVFGMPYNMDGSEHASTEAVRRFADMCRVRAGLPVEYVDERLSTVEAEHLLATAGLTRKQRKARVDKVAAALLLQAWLDMQG